MYCAVCLLPKAVNIHSRKCKLFSSILFIYILKRLKCFSSREYILIVNKKVCYLKCCALCVYYLCNENVCLKHFSVQKGQKIFAFLLRVNRVLLMSAAKERQGIISCCNMPMNFAQTIIFVGHLLTRIL